jgi:hypothetical protein
MLEKVFSVKIKGDELDGAREMCNRKSSSLPIQVRKFIKMLADGEILIIDNKIMTNKGELKC